MTQERLTALEDVAALATIGATYPELMLYLQAEMAKCEQALAAQQEPYGYVSIGDHPVFRKETPEIGRWETVYTTPPAQPVQEPVAWCVVGDGKFGEYKMGQTFVDYEATHTYWENRGYELVPVYTNIPKEKNT